MTIDKTMLAERAKREPVAFREETARALDACEAHGMAQSIRAGRALADISIHVLRTGAENASAPTAWRENDAKALAHVEALRDAGWP